MPRVTFDDIPDTGRVWIFGIDRPLEAPEEARLLAGLDAFLEGWAAHGAPLRAGRDWRHGRFVLVGLDEASVPPSGCSIDALVHALRDLEGELGVTIVDNAPVWFEDDGSVRRVSRKAFREMAGAGEVTPETLVFDNSVTRVGQVRAGEWRRRTAESWHRALLPAATPS